MRVKSFINKSAWFDYSVCNPFRTKKEIENAREYASVYGWSDLPKFSDFHPKNDDELLNGLKSMLEPKKEPTLRRLGGKMLYNYQRFIRRYTDVTKPFFKGRTIEEKEAAKRIEDIDKNNVKHFEDFQSAHQAKCNEWKMKEKARQLSEHCFIYKPPNNRRH